MQRHIRGVLSGNGNFEKINVQTLNVQNIVGPLEDRIKSLEEENITLRNKIDNIASILENICLKDLKDVVINNELHEGDSIGWAPEEKAWVVWGEAG